jgi:hypothetical protein
VSVLTAWKQKNLVTNGNMIPFVELVVCRYTDKASAAIIYTVKLLIYNLTLVILLYIYKQPELLVNINRTDDWINKHLSVKF